MVVHGLFLYNEAPARYKNSRRAYTILSCVILALSLIGTIIDLVRIEHLLVGMRGPPLSALASMTQGSSWITVLGTVCLSMGNVLGDGLLLYRCYVLWATTKWVLIAPVLLFGGFLGTGIAFLVYTTPELPNNIGLGTSWYLLSALLNISVTGLIVGRLVVSRRRLINSVPLADVKIYSGTISILIESALPFCLVSIIAAILSLPCISLPAATNYFTTLWVALSSFCPQLIIYRVASGRSFTSLAEQSDASTIQFSTGPGSRVATRNRSSTPGSGMRPRPPRRHSTLDNDLEFDELGPSRSSTLHFTEGKAAAPATEGSTPKAGS
ncbi:hypothetical protein BKA70DRAFT_6000 [Coprinopsis sp. MPI-PUGE-AT-0042]|nr:hypothetical protein BKA70DRAFT_6000 [Coprinopsis sp. MPI-PUGE-AT-0042]